MCAAITGVVLAAGMAAYQIGSGIKQKNKAYEELNKYERQDLDNAFEDIQISTVGSDLMREETARTASTLTDASQQSGFRGILGALPKIQEGVNDANQASLKYLDDQNIKRQYAIAQDEERIRAMREGRDYQNIAGLSSQINAGEQNINNGIMGIGSALMYGARNIEAQSQAKKNEDTIMVSGLDSKPQSLIPNGKSEYVNQPMGIGGDYNYQPMNPFGAQKTMTGDIWGQDPYGPEFYNKYFQV